MLIRYSRSAFQAVLLLPLFVLVACTVTPAPKVQCDSNLRPINSNNLVGVMGSSIPDRHAP